MAELSMVTRTTQLGAEVTPGVSVAANKRLGALGVKPSPKDAVEMFGPNGYKVNTVAIPGSQMTEGDVDLQPAYNDLVYVLSSVLQKVTPTRNIPTTGLSYDWVYNWSGLGRDAFQTYTVEVGDDLYAEKFTYGVFNSLSMDFSKQKVGGKASMIGQALQEAITLTPTPTDIDAIPVAGVDIDVFLDPTFAAIGTTKLLRDFALSFDLNDRYSTVDALDSANRSFVGTVEKKVSPTFKLTLAHDTQGQALTSVLRAGTTRYLRVVATGALIEAGHNYKLQIDAPVKISAPSSVGNQETYTRDWTMEAVHEGTFGGTLKVTITNTVAAL